MKKKFIFILFIFLILLSSCSKDDNEVKYERPEGVALKRYYDGSYEDGTRVYIITLTNKESLKNKNYKISDFELDNLVLVEEVVKAKEIKNLYKRENYQKILRLTFKDLDFDTDYIVRIKMAKDSRISSVKADWDYEISNIITEGAYLNNLNTNLKISNIYYVDIIYNPPYDSVIINDKDTFLKNKDKYKYKYMDEEILDKYDDSYFNNNSLIYLSLETNYSGTYLVINSIYEKNDKSEVDCSGYGLGFTSGYIYYYLLEIEGKINMKEIIYNLKTYGELK